MVFDEGANLGWAFRSLLLVPAALALSCGDPGADGTESPVRTQQELGASCVSSTETYHTNSSKQAKVIESATTHFCWMTRFGGSKASSDYNGLGGGGVYIGTDDNWYLDNDSSNLTTEARCVPKTCFTGNGVDDVVWVSTHDISARANCGGPPVTETNYTGWWGDAATVLRWFPGPGATNGSGENVQIIQSLNASKSTGIQAADGYHEHDESGDPSRPIMGQAVSLFVGTPNSGQLAQFTGAEFSVSGDYTLNLNVHTDEAICYFTKIYGGYRGAGDYVRLYQVADGSRNLWYARSRQDDGSGIRAVGRCFYFHQSNK